MKSHAELLQNFRQILSVNCLLDLRDAHVDMLTHSRARWWRNRVNVRLRLEIGFLLFALKINFHPIADGVESAIESSIELVLDWLHAEALLGHAVGVLWRGNHVRHDVCAVSFLHEVNHRVCLLNDVEEVDLRRRLCVGDGNGLNAEIDGVITVLGEKILEENVGEFDDV
jgi:hypothetical protein